MKPTEFPSVVVLDIGFSGYGVLRSLKKYQIPLIGFYGSKILPESYTRLCDRKIYFRDNDDLLLKLIDLAGSLPLKPVLILTTDHFVEFYVENRQELSARFLMHMPDDNTVALLMDKNRFSAYAKENDILIPRSLEVSSQAHIDELERALRFPVIVKPFKHTVEWSDAGFDKAYILETMPALTQFYSKVSGVGAKLIVQEYIEGNDDQVEYCLTYFSGTSECKMAFTGKKLRQWPVETGSTATTIPVDNEFVKNETIRIFKQLNYRGFGSIEYKYDKRDCRYYLIEPTVGRLNQQEYVATLSGFNIPLSGYCDVTGIDIQSNERINSNVVYIDEAAELLSTYVHLKRKRLTVSDWFKSIKGDRHYRYANWSDLGVLFGLIIKSFYMLFSFVIKRS
jgi:predicted ATP-grasp superfamily ATP-dependent carboligase